MVNKIYTNPLITRKLGKGISKQTVIVVSADGLAPQGDGTSAGTVMTDFGSSIQDFGSRKFEAFSYDIYIRLYIKQ